MKKILLTIGIVVSGLILLVFQTIWQAILLIPLTIQAVFFSKKKRGKRK